MRYPILLFDADNTLLDFDRSSREAFAATLKTLGIEPQEWHFDRYLLINRECWSMLEKGEIDPETVKWLRFRRFLDSIQSDVDPRNAGYLYLELLAQYHYTIDGAIDLLEALQQKGARLGLITNGLSAVQRPRFKSSGLEAFFETIVISEEIGTAKPMHGYFEYTLDQLNSPSVDDVLIIGDNPGSDILGGQNMGIDTCWYNPHRRSFPFDPGPTHQIDHLSKVENLLFP
jgi:2-haloacid dehalogenase